MTKTKKIGISVGAIVALVIVAVGVIMLTHKDNKTVAASAAAVGTMSSDAATEAGTTGGLAVGGGAALGQLGSNDQQAARSAASGTGGGNTSSGGAQLPDPSTFKDYEKYKDAKSAMFGEIVVGNGAELKANMKAAVAYKGWLTDGQVFDQSKANSEGKIEPFVFQIGANQVIPGWEQGLVGMKVGGTRILIVPPSVGYGANARGSIPPNSVLVFAVQLIGAE